MTIPLPIPILFLHLLPYIYFKFQITPLIVINNMRSTCKLGSINVFNILTIHRECEKYKDNPTAYRSPLIYIYIQDIINNPCR